MTIKELVAKISSFLKTDYLKNIVGQAGLVFVAQLIALVFSPLIARVYDENAFAEITGMVSLSSLFLVFSSFKLNQAIVLEEDDHKARQLMVLIFTINAVMVTVITLILFLFKDFFVRTFKVDNVFFFIPLYILSFTVFGNFDGWFVRQKKFKNKALAKIIESVTYLIFAFLLYYVVGRNDFGLAIGKISGIVLAVFFLVRLSKYRFPSFELKDLKFLLYKYKEFPIHEMPANFINVISLQMLVIFLGYFYSKSEVGFFGLANMVVLTPISFVSQAVSSIFYQKTVEDIHQKNYRLLYNTFLKTLSLLASLAVPGFIILWFFSETLIPFIFGSNWILTGKVTKILSFVFLMQMIVSPLSGILTTLNKLKEGAILQYARFLFMSISLLVMAKIFKLDFLNFVKGYTYCVVLSYLAYFLVIYKSVKSRVSSK